MSNSCATHIQKKKKKYWIGSKVFFTNYNLSQCSNFIAFFGNILLYFFFFWFMMGFVHCTCLMLQKFYKCLLILLNIVNCVRSLRHLNGMYYYFRKMKIHIFPKQCPNAFHVSVTKFFWREFFLITFRIPVSSYQKLEFSFIMRKVS